MQAFINPDLQFGLDLASFDTVTLNDADAVSLKHWLANSVETEVDTALEQASPYLPNYGNWLQAI